MLRFEIKIFLKIFNNEIWRRRKKKEHNERQRGEF